MSLNTPLTINKVKTIEEVMFILMNIALMIFNCINQQTYK